MSILETLQQLVATRAGLGNLDTETADHMDNIMICQHSSDNVIKYHFLAIKEQCKVRQPNSSEVFVGSLLDTTAQLFVVSITSS